jgi:hypothetical protein
MPKPISAMVMAVMMALRQILLRCQATDLI